MPKSKNRRKNVGSKIKRSDKRIKQTGEVFTPPELINKIYDKMGSECWSDPSKTILDPTCGSGNFLVEAKKRLLNAGHSEANIVGRLYGVDIMPDNITETRKRLDPNGDYTTIMENNFICADGLRYHYRFDGTHKYDDEVIVGVQFIGKRMVGLSLKDLLNTKLLKKLSKRKVFMMPIQVPYDEGYHGGLVAHIQELFDAHPVDMCNMVQRYSVDALIDLGCKILKLQNA